MAVDQQHGWEKSLPLSARSDILMFCIDKTTRLTPRILVVSFLLDMWQAKRQQNLLALDNLAVSASCPHDQSLQFPANGTSPQQSHLSLHRLAYPAAC